MVYIDPIELDKYKPITLETQKFHNYWCDKLLVGNVLRWKPIKTFGKTTQLVPEVYPMCAISPSSLKRAQLVP